MLQKAEWERKLAGIKMSRRAPSVNHLFFADDSLVLMKANAASAIELMRILHVYEQVSGQMINKSSILFSPNTQQPTRDQVK